MGFDWEDTLGDTSYEDAVDMAAESLERQNDDEGETAKELLAEADILQVYSNSQGVWREGEKNELKREGIVVRLYESDSENRDVVDGELQVWKDYGLDMEANRSSHIVNEYIYFNLNVRTGEIYDVKGEDGQIVNVYKIDWYKGLIGEAIENYYQKYAQKVIKELQLVVEEDDLIFE